MKCINTEIRVYILFLFGYIFETQAIDTVATLPPNIKNVLKNTNVSNVHHLLNRSRRIMVGQEATTNRPYMVYLKLPVNNPKFKDFRRWLCGGVIIHEEYILTSAACIEDAKHFYVVSGTYRHDERDDRFNNQCIKNGAKKAVWKCIPRNYVFDGHENDNIRWMNNDIAVVKVEDEFDFNRRIKGCDYVPKPICYNNQSQKLEEAGNTASVAGWGSTAVYDDLAGGTQNLLEANVKIISKKSCKKRWGQKYHSIIDNYMICSKDIVPEMSEICQEKYVDCTDVVDSDDSNEDRRRAFNSSELILHSAYHNESGRRAQPGSGGFCENDHGGPLVYSSGVNEVVIGIISACLVKERNNQCYGPFLYTSVYKNKNLISCAIYKKLTSDCDKLFRSSITHTEVEMSWADHPDGPAKSELLKMRRKQEEETANKSNSTNLANNLNSTEAVNVTISIISVNETNSTTAVDETNSTLADVKTNSTEADNKTMSTKVIKKKHSQKIKVLTSDKAEQHEGVIIRVLNATVKEKFNVNNIKETPNNVTFNNITKRFTH